MDPKPGVDTLSSGRIRPELSRSLKPGSLDQLAQIPFFIDDHRVTTDWQAALKARNKTAASTVPAKLIEATARIPGVLEDLAGFVARVEAIPAPVYEGLVRNASFREDQLCSLYYLDTSDPQAPSSVKALERWIEHLLARKRNVRATLARRLREVLGGTRHYL